MGDQVNSYGVGNVDLTKLYQIFDAYKTNQPKR